jgi:hypothetical protein
LKIKNNEDKKKIEEFAAQEQQRLLKEVEVQRAKNQEIFSSEISKKDNLISNLQTQLGIPHTFTLFLYNIESLQSQNERAESQLQQQLEDALSLNDQIKRLKLLLSKSRDMMQEREEELTQKFQEANLPWKNCMLECCVEGKSSIENNPPANSSEKWYLLSTNEISSLDSKFTPHIYYDSSQQLAYRWVRESQLHEWIDTSHSKISPSSSYLTMLSSLSLSLQSSSSLGDYISLEKYSRLHSETSHKTLDILQSEKQTLMRDMDSLTQQFQAYKLRAQSALKRIGKDDQLERSKQFEEDEIQWQEMKLKLQNAEVKLSEKENELTQLLKDRDDIVKEREELMLVSRERMEKLNELESKLRAIERKEKEEKADRERLIELTERSQSMERMIEQLQEERNELNVRIGDLTARRERPLFSHTLPGKLTGDENTTPSPVGKIGDDDDITVRLERVDDQEEKNLPKKRSSQSLLVSLTPPSPNGVVDDRDSALYLAHFQVNLFFFDIFEHSSLRLIKPSKKQ